MQHSLAAAGVTVHTPARGQATGAASVELRAAALGERVLTGTARPACHSQQADRHRHTAGHGAVDMPQTATEKQDALLARAAAAGIVRSAADRSSRFVKAGEAPPSAADTTHGGDAVRWSL
jgi:hypothetical protein